MNEQETLQLDLETQILNQILAQLYLNLASISHAGDLRSHTQKRLAKIDEYFGIERPSSVEIQSAIEERVKLEQDLGSELRARIIEELVVFYQGKFGQGFEDEMRAPMENAFNAILDDEKSVLSDAERQRLFDAIVTEVLGWGPLQPLLVDDAVVEIMVNGYDRIFVERDGKLEEVPSRFRDDEHLMGYIRRMVMPLGRKLDELNPIADARLPDGARVNVVIPPISILGPTVTIRKFQTSCFAWEDLIRWNSVGKDIVEFLRACVFARLNIVVAGGVGSGKTTVLNMVTGMIPANERIITVENAGELRLPQELKHLVRMESRPPNAEGKGEVTMRDLVVNATRMRADRIIVGEVRAAEALDLLQAMNTGHDGTMMTVHASGPRDVLNRLETMATMANLSLPLLTVRQMIASAVDLITYQERLQDGTRKMLKVSEVVGMQGDAIALEDIFEFRQTGVQDGKIIGHFTATGHIPKFLNRIRTAGVDLPMSIFTPS